LIKYVEAPYITALNKANLTLPDIKSCVLVGGGIRVPAVQNMLKRLVGENKIAQNLNGDEAAVLGMQNKIYLFIYLCVHVFIYYHIL